ncbi:serine acetyltransferase [Solibacillus sp. FSL W8-0474]|uniref:serine O-acetyltransferase n=1 Tax=Solibacillus sp. FSL W8-0474 TaxID=2975336 RepID=UPI0030FB121F
MFKLIKIIKSDLARYEKPNIIIFIKRALLDTNFISVMLYRLSHQIYLWRIPLLPKVIMNINKIMFSAEISYTAKIGYGFRINHSLGIVIGGGANIGDNFTINQGVTIGGNFGKNRYEGNKLISQPWIAEKVSVGAGAKILGPVIIGNNVIIGANSLVIKDITDCQVVAGIPAKVIKERRDIHATK